MRTRSTACTFTIKQQREQWVEWEHLGPALVTNNSDGFAASRTDNTKFAFRKCSMNHFSTPINA